MSKVKNLSHIRHAVGLSYCLQSHRREDTHVSKYAHRNYFQVTQNVYTGEARIQPKSILLDQKHKADHDRYKRDGKLFIDGLSQKARHKIQKAARVLEAVHKHEKGLKAYCSMITLTYGKDYPTDHESKKHLDTFLKRLRRLHPDCKYLWVAEKQKRGAIHYHILTPYFTNKDFVNASWNEIVNNWQASNNLPTQALLPNVIKVNQAGAYLAKYLQKEGQNIGGNGYGIDFKTRQLMKDESVYFVHHDLTHQQVNEIALAMISDLSKDQDKAYQWNSKQSGYAGAWISGVNHFQFTEWLRYKRHEYDLMLEHEDTQRRKELILKFDQWHHQKNNHKIEQAHA
jgi:hypothetical protein